jgi:hypothetical protein
VKGVNAKTMERKFRQVNIQVSRLRLRQYRCVIAGLELAMPEHRAKHINPFAFDAVGEHTAIAPFALLVQI